MIDLDKVQKVLDDTHGDNWTVLDHLQIQVLRNAMPVLIAEVKTARAWLKEEKAFQELQPDDWCTSRACWTAQEEYRKLVEQNTRESP